MSLKKSLLKNGLASIISKVVRAGEQLFLVPFFISCWGAEYYGEWLTLTIVPSVLAFSDLGFGTAASNSFVLRYASGNKKGAANMAKSGFLVITCLIILGLLITTLTIFILKETSVLEKSIINPNQAFLAISLMMISKLLNFYQQLYDAFYRSARKASWSINMLTLYSSLNIICGLVILLFGGGIVIFAMGQLCISILFNPIYAILGIKTLKLTETKNAIVLKADIIEAFQKGAGYLMSPLWQAIYFQGSTLAVRLTLGPLAVTVFNTVRTLSRSVNQVFGIINQSVFPELQFEIGENNMEKARKLFRVALASSFFAATLGMVFLYFFGMWFYELWTNNSLNPPLLMWYIFIIGIGFNSQWWTASVVFRAFNKPFKLGVAGLISACLSVILTYFLSGKFGLVGAAIGFTFLDMLLALYVLPKSCILINQNIKNLLPDTINDIKMFYTNFKH